MEKTSARSAKIGPSVGRASDGVVILRPPVGPKHFTQSQIEKTVDSVRDARTGQFGSGKASASGKALKSR